jgi:two-component system phosphate regulon sensor histidine kinase PhoR
LKANEKYRKEFIGNVSHELKTPIFNIQGYVLTLLDGGINDPEININYLERAEKNINRMITIVEDLDMISKIESGILNLNFETFDIIELVNEVFEMLHLKSQEKFIDFVLIKDKIILNVVADREKITQILVNLLTNSIRYGKQNGITKVRIRDINNKALIDVADNGIGIAKDDLPRIFERFYRVDKSRSQKSGGTGLGLSIVKHIIEAHQEKIFVDSELKIGTVFTFSLKKA